MANADELLNAIAGALLEGKAGVRPAGATWDMLRQCRDATAENTKVQQAILDELKKRPAR